MKKSTKFTTSRGERLSYGLYAFGAILSYYLIMSYLQLYMTDIGISAITVGLIFMVAKVWDAINDPVFGVMVDKLNLKGGKYKPWLKIATVLIPMSTILLFIVPSGVSIQVKVIWCAVAYVLWDTSYTMYDAPINSLVTAMTENLKERGKLYASAAFSVYLGALVIAISVPMLFPSIGWGATVVIIGILCLLAMLPLNFKAKERFAVVSDKELSIKQILMSVVHNKYLLILTLATVMGGITNFAMVLNGYFAIHNLGGEQWITILSLANALPMLLVVLFVPKVLEKVDKFTATIVARLITMAIDLFIFFIGYQNMAVFLSLVVLKNVFNAIWGVTSVMFVADCVEYGHFHNGERTQGISFSIKAFTNKLVVALMGTIAMFGLAAFGFVEGTGVVQSQQTIDGIWFLYAFVPIIGSAVTTILLALFYKLRDKDVQIMVRCNNGEISREEAEASFSRKV